MTRPLRRALGLALLPTIGLAAAIVLVPDRAPLFVHLWLLVVATIASGIAILALRSAYPAIPSSFDAPRPGDPVPPALEGLDRAEREVALSMSSAFDAHLRLRPALQEVAAGLLATRRGVDLERRPARARALVGDETWELIRPEREPPERRDGSGVDAATLDRVLGSLERL